jgi:hypothetical protein
MPSRRIEWRPFELQTGSEAYLFRYLESFAADCLVKFLREIERLQRDREDGTAVHLSRVANYAQVRSLLSIISRCITAPGSIQLRQLDHLRRMLLPGVVAAAPAAAVGGGMGAYGDGMFAFGGAGGIGGGGGSGGGGGGGRKVQLMTAEQVLQTVQAAGAGVGGGMNRDTNRILASVTLQRADEEARNKYSFQPLKRLR